MPGKIPLDERDKYDHSGHSTDRPEAEDLKAHAGGEADPTAKPGLATAEPRPPPRRRAARTAPGPAASDAAASDAAAPDAGQPKQ
jgi:hypothetical protein